MRAPELVKVISAARRELLTVALTCPPALVARRPTSDEWSVLEVVAHLIDVDYHYLGQALAARRNPGHAFQYFDDATWKAERPDILRIPLAEVLANLDRSHRTVLGALESISDAELDVSVQHPRGIPYTVRDVFLRFASHDANHAKQIEEILRRFAL